MRVFLPERLGTAAMVQFDHGHPGDARLCDGTWRCTIGRDDCIQVGDGCESVRRRVVELVGRCDKENSLG